MADKYSYLFLCVFHSTDCDVQRAGREKDSTKDGGSGGSMLDSAKKAVGMDK